MGLIVVAAAVAVLIALRLTAPKRNVAHAARVKFLDSPIVRRLVERGPIRDQAGKAIPLENKEFFVTEGESMVVHNIPAGATCIGEVLNPESRKGLRVGDIVVVDAPTQRSETGLRFRKIAGFDNGNVRFEGHNPRARDLVRAKVTHVLC